VSRWLCHCAEVLQRLEKCTWNSSTVSLSIKLLVTAYNPKVNGRKITFQNDSKFPVAIRVASDPDVSITLKLEAEERKLVAIELKGGTDVSNTWNRLGEAEKSHVAEESEAAVRLNYPLLLPRPHCRCHHTRGAQFSTGARFHYGRETDTVTSRCLQPAIRFRCRPAERFVSTLVVGVAVRRDTPLAAVAG
jgi:hypothetical protein